MTTTLKTILIVVLTTIASAVFAQDNKSPKKKSQVKTSATQTASPQETKGLKKSDALNDTKREDIPVDAADMLQERGAISEQGMPSEQPKARPSNTAPATVKPNSEAAPAVSPK